MNPNRPTSSSHVSVDKEDAHAAGAQPDKPLKSAEQSAELNFGPEAELAPFAPIVIKPKPDPMDTTSKTAPKEPAAKGPASTTPPKASSVYFSKGEPERPSF